MRVKKLMESASASPKRFASLVKRLSKMRPGTAVAKRVRALSQSELKGILVKGGKGAAERAIKAVKIGKHKLEVAEKKGTLKKYRTPIALGMQAVEIWLLASRVRSSATVKHKAVRPARKTAKKR
jgi:hypothetical protein